MKTKLASLLIALLALPGVYAEERVTLEQVPRAVQKTLDDSRDLGPVKEINRRTDGGRVVYDVEFENLRVPDSRREARSGGKAGTLYLIWVEAVAEEFSPDWIGGTSREKIREVMTQGG